MRAAVWGVADRPLACRDAPSRFIVQRPSVACTTDTGDVDGQDV
jgi:hypothetical protein